MVSSCTRTPTIRGRKKSQDTADKKPLVFAHFIFPVADVLGKVDFLSCPKRSFGPLVETPDFGILDGKEHEALRVRGEERLGELGGGEPIPSGVVDGDGLVGGGGVVDCEVGHCCAG